MNKKHLSALMELIDRSVEPDTSLIYLFYTLPDGTIHNLSVTLSARGVVGTPLSDRELLALANEYPAMRGASSVTIDRPGSPISRWIAADQVMRHFSISRRTLRRWTIRYNLPTAVIGNHIYYDAHRLDHILSSLPHTSSVHCNFKK